MLCERSVNFGQKALDNAIKLPDDNLQQVSFVSHRLGGIQKCLWHPPCMGFHRRSTHLDEEREYIAFTCS